ncbi:hypothetical protein ACFQL4_27600 [Halosimplex aquaticum]
MSVISWESTIELIDETTETMRIAPLSSAENSDWSVFVSESSCCMSTGRSSASARKAANTPARSASVTIGRSPVYSSHEARRLFPTRRYAVRNGTTTTATYRLTVSNRSGCTIASPGCPVPR